MFELLRNHHVDQNFAKCSLKTPKMPIFLKNLQFSEIFGAFGVENVEFLVASGPDFCEVEPPFGPRPPPNL